MGFTLDFSRRVVFTRRMKKPVAKKRAPTSRNTAAGGTFYVTCRPGMEIYNSTLRAVVAVFPGEGGRRNVRNFIRSGSVTRDDLSFTQAQAASAALNKQYVKLGGKGASPFMVVPTRAEHHGR